MTALWMLIGLQLKGWFRYFVRNLGTFWGAIFGLFGLLVFGFWLFALLLMPTGQGGLPAETIRTNGPAFLLIYCLLNVVLSTGEKGIYFTPAEVNYLFSGPFTRRQILFYKILATVFLGLPTTLLLAMVFRIHAPSFLSAYVGLLLMFLFMSLLSMALNLIVMTVGANLYSRVRQVVIGGVLALVGGYVVIHGLSAAAAIRPELVLQRLNEFAVWRGVTWPLRSFIEVFLAVRIWPDLLAGSVPALLVNAVLLAVIFLLDANYLETAATASARVYARLQRVRAGNLFATDENKPGNVRFGLPVPPHWGGIGPIVWRQMTTAFRGFGKILFLFGIFGLCMIAPMVATMREQGATGPLLGVVGGMTLWVTIMLTTLVPFDFRGDVDRLDVLKALPVASWRLTIGQLLTPTLLLSLLQWLVLAVVLALLLLRPVLSQAQPLPAAELRLLVLVLVGSSAFVLPFNFLVFGLENLLFLLFPTRIMANQPGDFQAIGRNVLFVFAKMIALFMVVGMAAVFGWAVFLLSGMQIVPALAGAWVVLVCCAAVLVPLVAMAFNRFDVGRDTPP